MGLTVRGKDADRFWFRLFHEVAHIIMGHISKPFGTDADDEHDADKFARDILIDEVAFNAFAKNGYLTRATISQFAARMGISPGIVVGRLQKENFIPYNQFNDLKVRYEITA